MPKPKPLKTDDVLRIIGHVPLYGRIIPTKHFWEQIKERNLDIDIKDAIKVLAEATTVKPTWNTIYQTWNYDIHGQSIEREKVTLRIAVEEKSDEVVLVTVF